MGHQKRGTVRISGGQWRSRKLVVPDYPGLRPTPDRVRETLFNWLSLHLPAARCLDAFAGTGALGFEAASRGAAAVILAEVSVPVLAALTEARERLQAEQVSVIQAKMPQGMAALSGPFDVVFLDPPWQTPQLGIATLAALAAQKKLAADAVVYLELPAFPDADSLPPGWHILKKTRAGEVHACLLACSAE